MNSSFERPPDDAPAFSLRNSDSASRHKAMVDVVRQLLREGGVPAVTMRAVADRLGVSTTMVYSQFADKADLVRHAIDLDYVALAQRLQSAIQAAPNAHERVRRAAFAYVDWGLNNPTQYTLLFIEPHVGGDVEDSLIENGNPQFDAYALVCELARSFAEEEGLKLSPQMVNVLGQMMWEMIHGVVSLRLSLPNDPWLPRLPPEEHVEHVVNVLLAGIRAMRAP